MPAKKTAATKPAGRTIAVTHLLEGSILMGETVTISTIIDAHPYRTNYRGIISDIRRHGDGRDYAMLTVIGMPGPIALALEPIP